jgi:hypothetical protein
MKKKMEKKKEKKSCSLGDLRGPEKIISESHYQDIKLERVEEKVVGSGRAKQR